MVRARGFEPYLSAKLTETQAAARSALAVLRDVEWQYFDSYGPQCPKCHTEKDLGHGLGCALAAAIRDLEAVLDAA